MSGITDSPHLPVDIPWEARGRSTPDHSVRSMEQAASIWVSVSFHILLE